MNLFNEMVLIKMFVFYYLLFVHFSLFVCFLSGRVLFLFLSLLEVNLQELLQVEITELLSGASLKQLLELHIRVDDATVLGILEVVGLDVLVDFLADRSAGDKCSDGLSDELGKLVTDSSGLLKTRHLGESSLALL